MSDAAAFRATYSDFKLVRTRKCVQLVFEVPIEQANIALTALDGMPNPASEIWCAIARLNTGAVAPNAGGGTAAGHSSQAASRSNSGVATPVQREGREVASPTRSSRNSYLTRAIMLPKDGLFRRWLEIESKLDDVDENEAAAYIRTRCGVTTRSEIKPGTEAATKLDFIESAFMCWRDAPRVGA